MTRGPVRAMVAVVGAVSMLGAGVLAGGAWWATAGAGAVASIGAAFDRQFSFAHVLALLGTVVGLAAVGHDWYVPVLVAATFASIELGAATDRITVVRREVPELSSTGGRVLGATALCAAVLLLGQLQVAAATAGVLAAAGAAVVATRIIAR